MHPSLSQKNIIGVGLRQPHFDFFLNNPNKVDFLEIHSENFFSKNPAATKLLTNISKNYHLSMHSIGLSLGSPERPCPKHLKKLKNLITQFQPILVSDHISWSKYQNHFFNDLLPIPYTKESLANIVDNIKYTQDFLGRNILVENPSNYINFKNNDFHEWDFINQTAELSKCAILLDINNIFVSCANNKIDPYKYLKQLNHEYVREIHLAGPKLTKINEIEIYIDTHNNPVLDEVWRLYEFYLKNYGPKPTLIEWDQDIPAIETLLDLAAKAKSMH